MGVLTSIILFSGILGVISFEDADAAKKPKEIVVVGSKVKDVVRNEKLATCDINFIDDAGASVLKISIEDKGGKIKADVPDDSTIAEIQCIFKDGSSSELLSIELDDDDKKQKIRIQSGTDSRVDSFFDVFYDIELYSVDSFFDIFTDLQTDVSRVDGHVTVLKSQADSFFDIFYHNFPTSDSFFDVFFDIDARSTQNQQDIHTIQTEIVALDLRGQSCDVGDVVTGINPDGTLICTEVQTGTAGDLASLQSQIDDLNERIRLLHGLADCTVRGPDVDLHGCDLTSADLIGANLSGANLSGAILSGVDLTGADLTGAVLSDAELNFTILTNAILINTNFENAVGINVNLENADLTGANLSGASLPGVILTGAILDCFDHPICN